MNKQGDRIPVNSEKKQRNQDMNQEKMVLKLELGSILD